MAKKRLHLTVNGQLMDQEIEESMRLLDVLRDQLFLTGTKEGCGIGECGACTVILDGKAVNSCMVLALSADGSVVETVEGMGSRDKLHPIQESFLDNHALQCGFCTPGMLMSAKALLDENPQPSEEEIKEAISGNLCRCTGYVQIVEAIRDAGSRRG
ncbi:MAG: (2Fe-2S)-binding protein [Desulfitobacteriaceae bacterium]